MLKTYRVTLEYIVDRFDTEWQVAESTCKLLRAVADFKITKIEPIEKRD